MAYQYSAENTAPLSITHHLDMESLLEKLSVAIDQALDFPPMVIDTTATVSPSALRDVPPGNAGKWQATERLDPIENRPYFTSAQLRFRHSN